MCLAVPGKVLSINRSVDPAMGRVSFAGVEKEVCLELVPEVKEGDYVVVHVGFALNTVDEAEAAKIFEHLDAMAELEEAGGETQ